MTDIRVAQLTTKTRTRRPLGFCVDIGASKSVSGREELNRILAANSSHRRRLLPSNSRFRFADAVYDSLGRISIPFLAPAGVSGLYVEMYVVAADIAALLGMDFLNKESLTPCTYSNRLIKRMPHTTPDGHTVFVDEWFVPLILSPSNHLHAQMSFRTNVFFTRTQLTRLHRQFSHPSAHKPYNLFKRSRPENATPASSEKLKDIL